MWRRWFLIALALGCMASQGHRTNRNRARTHVAYTGGGGWSNSYSVDFDGVDENIQRADEDALECDDEDEMTVCFWVNQDVNPSNTAFVSKSTWFPPSNSGSWSIGSSTNNAIQFYVGTNFSNNVRSTNLDLVDGTWQHVCGVYDGSETGNQNRAKVYLDGSNVTATDSGTIPDELPNGNGALSVGSHDANGGSNQWTNGKIDMVYVWCHALTAAEISNCYNSGTPADCSGIAEELRVDLRLGEGSDTASVFANSASPGNDFTGNNLEAGDIQTDVPP